MGHLSRFYVDRPRWAPYVGPIGGSLLGNECMVSYLATQMGSTLEPGLVPAPAQALGGFGTSSGSETNGNYWQIKIKTQVHLVH